MNLPTSLTAGLRPHPNNWTKEPDKANTHCLYCNQPVPNHSKKCVIPQRTVVVELTTRMVIAMPRSFDESSIDFSMNSSSACKSRYIDQLHEETNREENLCNICSRTDMKFIREATEEDHEQLHFIPKQDE